MGGTVRNSRGAVAPVMPSDDVASVPDRYVACRTLGHAWDPSDRVVGAVPVSLSVLGCLCLRCTSMRLDGIDARGKVAYRRYQYADGYLRKKGQQKLTRIDYRLQMLSINLAKIKIKASR